jgi:LTXXQ motif family protein
MNASKPMAGLFALAFALGSVGIGSARAQSDQDHSAHHPDGAQTQTAPAPGMPMQQGGAMPGMMGGNMQPMMRMMQEMHGRMAQQEMGAQMGMMRPDHIEGRIAFLRAELGITDAQQPQWNAFADALRAQAGKMQPMHAQMMQGGMPQTWPDRLTFMEHMLSARLDAVKAMEEPVRALYAVLSPEQQKKANELVSHRMGGM